MADDDTEKPDEKPVVVADASPPPASAPDKTPPVPTRSGPSVQELFGIPSEITKELGAIKRQEIADKDRIMRASEGQVAADRALAKRHYDAAGIEAERMQPWNATEEYRKVSTSPLEAFGSFASVFAIVASAFTHAPLENALNGSAAAMNAIKKGDDEAYERGFTAWKANMDLFQKRFNMQNTLYNDALTLMDKDTQQGRIALQNAAMRFGDKKALFLLENGFDKELIDLQTSRVRQFQAMTEARDKITESTFKNQAFQALQNEYLEKNKRQPDALETVQMWNYAHGVREPWQQQLMQQFIMKHQGDPDLPEKAAKYAQSFTSLGRGSQSGETQHLLRWRDEFKLANGREPTTAEELDEIAKFNRSRRSGSGSDINQWRQGFIEEYKNKNDGRTPSESEITAALAKRRAELQSGTGDPARQAFNAWKIRYATENDGEEPDPDTQQAKWAEIKESIRSKNQKEKAIAEIQEKNPGMSLVQATKKYNLDSVVRSFDNADKKYLPAVPIALRHLQALDELTSPKYKEINDPTGWARFLPQHLLAEYGGFNTPQAAWAYALAGAKAEMTQLGAGGARLKADALAALNRLPNNFADSGFNRGLIQELERDVVSDARTRIALLEQSGRNPLESEYVRQQFNSFGIYSTKDAGDPLLVLRKNPEALSPEQGDVLSRNFSTLSVADQKRLIAERDRRKALKAAQ